VGEVREPNWISCPKMSVILGDSKGRSSLPTPNERKERKERAAIDSTKIKEGAAETHLGGLAVFILLK